MNVTYFGHSCFQIELGGANILFDPFIRPNPLAAQIDVEKILPDYLLITHGHNDHLADAEEIAHNSNAFIVANWEICTWFSERGLNLTHPMNCGGTFQTPFGSITMTQAVHSSSLPDGSYGGNPTGDVIHAGDRCLNYAGDTDLFSDMQLIAKRHQPEVAFLPLGDTFTMDVISACEAAIFLNVKRVIGMHYDTFASIKIDHQAAITHFANNGIELLLMDIGETRTL